MSLVSLALQSQGAPKFRSSIAGTLIVKYCGEGYQESSKVFRNSTESFSEETKIVQVVDCGK